MPRIGKDRFAARKIAGAEQAGCAVACGRMHCCCGGGAAYRRLRQRTHAGAGSRRRRRQGTKEVGGRRAPAARQPRRRLLPGRWPGRQSAGESRPNRGCRAQGGTARARRQQALYGVRPAIRALPDAHTLPAARHRQLVRTQVQRPAHFQRRALRHVRDDRRARDAADSELCARDQPRQRPQRDRAHQRPRAVSFRTPDRLVLRRRIQARLRRSRQRAPWKSKPSCRTRCRCSRRGSTKRRNPPPRRRSRRGRWRR